MNLPIKILLALSLLSATGRANTVILDTFGPLNTYNQDAGFAVTRTPSLFEEAARFTAAGSGQLATIDLGLTWENTPGPVQVFLYGDAAGTPNIFSQTLLGSVTPTGQFGTTDDSVVTLTVPIGVSLTAGTAYWLVLKPGDDMGQSLWNESLSSPGAVNFSEDDFAWEPIPNNTDLPVLLPALRLTISGVGAAVPESGSGIGLLFGSLAAIVFLQRQWNRRSESSR